MAKTNKATNLAISGGVYGTCVKLGGSFEFSAILAVASYIILEQSDGRNPADLLENEEVTDVER